MSPQVVYSTPEEEFQVDKVHLTFTDVIQPTISCLKQHQPFYADEQEAFFPLFVIQTPHQDRIVMRVN